MKQKAAKIALGIAVGTAFGGCILPRIIFKDLYGDTWPPVWKEAILYFATGFIAAFSVLMLLYRIREKRSKGQRSGETAICRNDAPGFAGERPLFDSKLPMDIDWEEVNHFLRTTDFCKRLLLDDWRESDAFTEHPVSDTCIACMQCLHEDLSNCYKGAFAFDENGQEDRHAEYRLLRENLHRKYEGLDANNLEEIYLYYLQEDR